MLELTTAAAPHRDPKSLRRGVFHNSRRLDDGRWTWRYDTIRDLPDFDSLWDDVDRLSAPITLVRGGTSGFVSDEDAAELARRAGISARHASSRIRAIRCKATSLAR